MMGIEQLRHAVRVLDSCNESFNQRFTTAELLQLTRMMSASGWDIYPDQWTAGQVRRALAGTPPQFDERERPIENEA